MVKVSSKFLIQIPAHRSWGLWSWDVHREEGAAGRRSGWWGNTGSPQSGFLQNMSRPGPRARTQVGYRSRCWSSSQGTPRLLQNIVTELTVIWKHMFQMINTVNVNTAVFSLQQLLCGIMNKSFLLVPNPGKTSYSGREPKHYVPLLYSIVNEALLYSIIND